MIKVFINSRLVQIVNDPVNPPLIPMSPQEEINEAWDIIGKQPFGSCFECHDKHGLMEEFLVW